MKWKLDKVFLESHRDQIIKYGVIVLVAMVAFFVFGLTHGPSEEEVVRAAAAESSAEEIAEEGVVAQEIVIDVAGAVKNPQVVRLPPDSRVDDAIEKAGGITDKADLSQINRAAFLTDGEKLYIPAAGEKVAETAGGNASSADPAATDAGASGGQNDSSGSSTGKININTASSEELQKINGIGPVTAGKIVTYRSQNGAFKRIEDVKKVDGIGDKTYENMKDQIMV